VRAMLSSLLAVARAWHVGGAEVEATALVGRVCDLARGRVDTIHRDATKLLAGMAAALGPDVMTEDGQRVDPGVLGWPGAGGDLDSLVRGVLVGRIGRRGGPSSWNAVGTGRR